jgi:hypothetical protein
VKKQSFTNTMYLLKSLLRGAVMIVNLIVYYLVSGNDFDFWLSIAHIATQSALFWILFDPALSYLRRKPNPWLYLGKTAPTDTLFNNIREQYAIKILYLVISVTILIITI